MDKKGKKEGDKEEEQEQGKRNRRLVRQERGGEERGTKC